jgi:2-amino-4-hydroxy-6-hydroxymethyldihydropteridine diphosphokinase
VRVKAYVGIGSNVGDPEQQVRDVFMLLDRLRDSRLLAASSLYRTEPVGDIPQDDFINAVACIETGLAATSLLLELQAIEHAFYRDRENEETWGPRTMDLDILLYDNMRFGDSHLTVPHPQIKNRLFVLVPLKEIAGDLYIPALGSLQYMIERAPPMRIERLAR